MGHEKRLDAGVQGDGSGTGRRFEYRCMGADS